ncbi:MAG: hypothetical protein IPH35_04015 [Rhodoferax sp.]|nr:hypothetical protein [Rhodoferax sp.]
MANDHALLSVSARADEIPPQFGSLDDISHLISNGGPFCFGYSNRKPALSNMLEKVVRAYDKKYLAYLSESAATLNPEKVYQAIKDIESLLVSFEKDPRAVAICVEQDSWTESEILEGLSLPTEQNPDSQWDGDDLPYMIRILKAHLAVLKFAETENLYVLHGRTSHGR